MGLLRWLRALFGAPRAASGGRGDSAANLPWGRVAGPLAVLLEASAEQRVLCLFPGRTGAQAAPLPPAALHPGEVISDIVWLDPEGSALPLDLLQGLAGLPSCRCWTLAPAAAGDSPVLPVLSGPQQRGRLVIEPSPHHPGVLLVHGPALSRRLALGTRLSPALLTREPRPDLLIGGFAEGTLEGWRRMSEQPDLLGGLEVVLLPEAAGVEPEPERSLLPYLGVKVSQVGRTSSEPADEEVQRALLEGDAAAARARLPELSPELQEELAETALLEDDPEQAALLAELLCSLDPENGLAWYFRGMACSLSGDDQKAVRCYTRACEAGSPEPRAWCSRAVLAAGEGELETALELAGEGLCHLPGDVPLRTLSIQLLAQLDRREEAHRLLAAAPWEASEKALVEVALRAAQPPPLQDLSRCPHLARRAHELAAGYRSEGRRDEAIALLYRACELDPLLPAAVLDLGAALAEQDRDREALALYQHALPHFPALAPLHFNLGNTLTRLERTEEALAEYRRCLELLPRWSSPRLNLIAGLARLGRSEEAERERQILAEQGARPELLELAEEQLADLPG